MAIDPICGMTVDEKTALSTELNGQKHYFCSEHCRDKFIAQSPAAKAPPTAQLFTSPALPSFLCSPSTASTAAA